MQLDMAARIEAAVSHHYEGRSERALKELDKLLEAAAGDDFDKFAPVIHAHRATLLRNLQNFDKAIEASNDACRGFRRLGNIEEVVRQMVMMASIWSRIGEFETALELCTEAGELAELADNLRLRASVESNRGIALGRLGRYADEAQAARNALDIMRELNDRRGTAIASLNLGACFSNLGRFDEALPLLLDARRTLLELGYMMPSFAAANGLIEVYLHTGDLQKAREVLRELKATQAASDQHSDGEDSPGTEEQEALISAAEGQLEQALEQAYAGAAILESRDMRTGAARLRALAADLHLRAAQPGDARQAAQAAHDLLTSCEPVGSEQMLRVLVPWIEAELALDNLNVAAELLKDAQAQLMNASASYLVNNIYRSRVDRLAIALQSRIPAR